MYCVSCEVRTEFICYVEESRPPLWSSDQSSWLQIQISEFDSRRYQIFWEVVGLERGPLSPVTTTEELLERKSIGSGLETENTAVGIRHSDHGVWWFHNFKRNFLYTAGYGQVRSRSAVTLRSYWPRWGLPIPTIGSRRQDGTAYCRHSQLFPPWATHHLKRPCSCGCITEYIGAMQFAFKVEHYL
jgi:hypothetical protein